MLHFRNSASGVLAICLLFFASYCTSAFGPPAAAQSASTIKIELYPQGQHTNPAVLFINGNRYEPALLVPVPLESSDALPEVKFLSHVISANKNGPLEEILTLWNPAERSAIQKAAADPSAFEANRKFFQNITTSRLLAQVVYGSYEIFFVAHTLSTSKTFIKEYPATQVNGSFVLTNALQNDPMFMYLSTKYAQTLSQTVPADKQISRSRSSRDLYWNRLRKENEN